MDSGATQDRVRLRAIVLGLLLAVLLCGVTPFNNAYQNGTPLAGGHFPFAPFFLFFWLSVGIAALGRLRSSSPLLTGRELFVVWILMAIVSGIPYTGLVRTFFINLTAPYHFASIGNRWQETLQPLLPQGWYPQSQETIELLYRGLEGGRQMGWWQVFLSIPWETWLPPLLAWGAFVLLCYWVMLCLVNLFSHQWIANEKMNFPLLRVPQLMEEALTQNRLGRFLADRFLVVGLLVTILVHLVNGLHFYFPEIPQIPTLILAGPYFPKHGLFSGFHKLKIYIYPAFIGFAFLTPRQISFSFWFFFLVGGLLFGLLGVLGYNIPAAALGITFGPTLARPEETQMIGAYGVFFFFILWLARYHIKGVLWDSFVPGHNRSTQGEYFSASLSFWGLILGAIGLTFWCSHYGMPLGEALALLGVFFMVLLVASRVICQGGIAYFTLTAAPTDGILAFFGSRFFTNIGLIMAAVMQKVMFVDLRESVMPSLVHGAKVNEGIRNKRLILAGTIAALLAGVVVSFVAMLTLCHKYGIGDLRVDWATRTTLGVYENVQRLLDVPGEPREWVFIFSAVGAVVMLVLVIVYQRFYWWPIHPIGYLTTYSSAMRILWFSFLVGWLCNHLSLRYGGVSLFKKVRFFFVGLIIGDFLMAGGWALVGLFTYASYQVLPG
ncbi:MAG: hypothetical protein JSU72_05705 [Deltaproteobacteria bacterium]|nr:MAG: hypothetical protein JSU72_05705 [Deltaproteobacteria bacterium]